MRAGRNRLSPLATRTRPARTRTPRGGQPAHRPAGREQPL